MKTIVSRATGRRGLLKGATALAGVVAMPAIVKGQSGTIKIGVPTILSGRVAVLGQTTVGGLKMTFDKFNAAGGINGRKVELVVRDSKGAPQEAAKVTRDLINNDGCQLIVDGEASSGAFAVQEVIREIGVFCIHSNSETSSLTADPKLHVPTAFRTARMGIVHTPPLRNEISPMNCVGPIVKGRWRSPSPARMATCSSIPRRSIRRRCSISARACWAATSIASPPWYAASAAESSTWAVASATVWAR